MKKVEVKTLVEYQEKAREHAIYPEVGNSVVYPMLGVVGEAGEAAEKVKKLFRDKDGEIDEEFKEDLMKELGDIMWYIAQVAAELDVTLEDIASLNLTKLQDRLERDKVHGDGDNR